MDRGWKPNVEISPTCPRCGSTNTKFCYYNNYSLTQPRYFCKGCRRYWTKGGSLRNVPVGGGCRKSRRGKHITSRGFASAGGATSGHCRTGLSPNGTPALPESAGSLAGAEGPSIDLALVYANFLNPKPTEPGSRLPTAVGPPFQFSSVETLPMDLSIAHLAQESCFLECRSLSDKSSDPHISYGNPFYLGEMDSSEKNHLGDHHFNSMMNNMNNNLLPSLPGEETVSEGMVWPSPDLMFSGVHSAHATQSTGVLSQAQASNQHLDQSGILFDIPNYGLFSGLEK